MSFYELLLYYKKNWYHDFSGLGKKTFQFSDGGYKEAQEDKQSIIFKQIDHAIMHIEKVNNKNTISGIELFCADGFFSNYAIRKGVNKMTGIDLEDESGEGNKRFSVLEQGRLITKLLGNTDKIDFVRGNVFDIKRKYELGLCIGGLYHLENPKDLLILLRQNITSALIIQTIVSLENEDANYFESPCPGWSWGCRFSHEYLKKITKEAGWEIIEEERNEISCNERRCDRGSSYLLCIPG